MFKSVKLTFAAFGVLAISAMAASAAPLVGTGNPSGGVPGTPELRWLLPVTQTAVIVNPATPYWLDPASVTGVVAKWISPYIGGPIGLDFTCTIFCPADDPTATVSPALYKYTVTFDNPGQQVDIRWATDNTAVWYLNTVALSGLLTGTGTLTSLTAFSLLATDFIAGVNTLSVWVTNLAQNNKGNPTGLLVDVDVSTVPLPPALLLFGSALVGMNWLRRRRTGQKLGSPMMVART